MGKIINFLEKRIGDLKFEKSVYICKEPEHCGYSISVYKPNKYFGHEDDYIKENEDYYRPKDIDEDISWHIHKSCFQNPETSYVIASWAWNDNKEGYDFKWVDDRPLDYCKTKEDIIRFYEMTEYGFQVLNFLSSFN